MARLTGALVLLTGLLLGNTAAAQEIVTSPPLSSLIAAHVARAADTEKDAAQIVPSPRVSIEKTPASMHWLYASTIATQGIDLHSTLRGVRSGRGVEANPLMAGMVKHPAALIATKAALTTCTVVGAHKLAKSHRRAAIVTLIAINATYTAVAIHNYRIGRGR